MSIVTDDAPLSLRVGWTAHESPDAEAVRVLHPCKPSPLGNDARCSGPAVASSHCYRIPQRVHHKSDRVEACLSGVVSMHTASACVRATCKKFGPCVIPCLNLQMHRAVTWGWTFPGNLGTCRVFPAGLILSSMPKLYSPYMHQTGDGESNFEIHRTSCGYFKCFQSGARPQTGWGSKTCRTPTPT